MILEQGLIELLIGHRDGIKMLYWLICTLIVGCIIGCSIGSLVDLWRGSVVVGLMGLQGMGYNWWHRMAVGIL